MISLHFLQTRTFLPLSKKEEPTRTAAPQWGQTSMTFEA